MNKEIFIEAIEAIQKQVALDIEVSKHLGKAFPDAFEANLLPKNHFLQNALIHVLQVEMNDLQSCEHEQSWIEYFLWELNFGEENYRLKVTDNGKGIDVSINNSENNNHRSFAMEITRERLLVSDEKNENIQIESPVSETGAGTCITIYMPYKNYAE